MFQVSDKEFHEIVDQSLMELPKLHINALKNIAIIVEDQPNQEKRSELKLKPYQSLFGLYEGVPVSRRQGNTKILPDKITLYKLPIESSVNDLLGLKEQIKHTLWHEIAHYYGLDHKAISELE